MTNNRVEETASGLNRVDLRPLVAAGAPTAPPPGVLDDDAPNPHDEQAMIDRGYEDTEGTLGEDTVRNELDANDAGEAERDSDDPLSEVAETIASRPG